MRIRIAHTSICRYDPPATGAIQVLRLTPRNHEGQYVVRWRIGVEPDARLAAHEDAFGNLTHVFTADGPLPELRIEVDGVVETQSTDGVVRGTVERFPPSLFLRDTALTAADAAIGEFAQALRAESSGQVLGELHALLARLHADMVYDPDPARPAADAAQAFARKSGGAADLAHIFIGAAHSLGIPARLVAGYFRGEERAGQSGHFWAEAHVGDLGWVGFDPANGFCPTDAHVRVAVGLDALGAAPLRGTRYGVGGETLEVAITVGQ
ncbi:MAG TPA: transglutaminase family protein [Xanthobacteraceae bacterium]|nr:transglutaminase family protein [Xanthobacteraceae bacterium]